jgi:hypothetical protein
VQPRVEDPVAEGHLPLQGASPCPCPCLLAFLVPWPDADHVFRKLGIQSQGRTAGCPWTVSPRARPVTPGGLLPPSSGRVGCHRPGGCMPIAKPARCRCPESSPPGGGRPPVLPRSPLSAYAPLRFKWGLRSWTGSTRRRSGPPPPAAGPARTRKPGMGGGGSLQGGAQQEAPWRSWPGQPGGVALDQGAAPLLNALRPALVEWTCTSLPSSTDHVVYQQNRPRCLSSSREPRMLLHTSYRAQEAQISQCSWLGGQRVALRGPSRYHSCVCRATAKPCLLPSPRRSSPPPLLHLASHLWTACILPACPSPPVRCAALAHIPGGAAAAPAPWPPLMAGAGGCSPERARPSPLSAISCTERASVGGPQL